MVDTILDSYSKDVESTLRLQQRMLQVWTMQWSPFGTEVLGLPPTEKSTTASDTPAGAWLEQLITAQSKWAEAFADMLKRHQETLEEEYRAGTRAIDDAFRVGEASDPDQFLRLSQELWRRNCDVLKMAATSQMHDVQAVILKWYEAVRGHAGNASLSNRNRVSIRVTTASEGESYLSLV